MIKVGNINENYLNKSPKDMAYKDLKTSLGDFLFALGIFCEFLVSFRGNLPLIGEPTETAVSNIFILLGMLFFSLKIILSMDIKKDWMIFCR